MSKTPQAPQEHLLIRLCLAGTIAVIAGAAIGLLSWAGGVRAPLAVAAGLTTAGPTFFAVIHLLKPVGEQAN
uniref:hypothetical protein n=1 Tax=Actinoplanes sp. CA-151224 TaxID=3239904 RepID=UPI003F49B387